MTANSQSLVMGDSFTIRLTMLSDWHVGTGAGIPGSIDSLIARDSEGFPYVPAKTLVGMWRDALETLTLGLDGGTAETWSRWTAVVFGSQPNVDKIPDVKPRPAILALQPARLTKSLRELIGSTKDIGLKQALTFLKPEIKTDDQSGTAETEMLRAVEMGRIHAVMQADCKLDFERIAFDPLDAVSNQQRATIIALLIASAKLVERLGGKRRRGSGKCELRIIGQEGALAKAVEVLKIKEFVPPPMLVERITNHDFAEADSGSNWQTLEYMLRLETPVSIVTATLGNVSETLDFIPGTYLLPHITKGQNFFKHVANGDLQVSPATIEVDGKRGLPVPTFLSAHKVGGGFEIPNTVFSRVEDKTNKDTPQLKPYRDGYVNELEEENQLPVCKATPKTLLMHNTVEDKFQRPTENVGGVYSRQAIAAQTTLRGEIRFKASLAAQLDLVGSPSTIRLGTSKKDDYGLVNLTISEAKGEDDHQEIPGSQEKALENGSLVVYLESDLLLRNGSIRQTNLATDLKEKLEEELTVNLVVTDSLIQTRRIESWHEGWGFPRPTLIAMQAGSCIKFEIKDFDSGQGVRILAQMRRLQNSGIGERRGEGYGRMRFNPKLLTGAINGWTAARHTENGSSTDDSVKDSKPNSLDGSVSVFAEQIETTAWRAELQRAVLLIADDKDQRLKIFGFEEGGRPSMSQIGGLRSVIGRMSKLADGERVSAWLTHLEDTGNRLERWAQNKQKAKDKLGQLKALVTDEAHVWRILEEAKTEDRNVWQWPATLVRTKGELRKALWPEAVRALFDACARAHKREGGSK